MKIAIIGTAGRKEDGAKLSKDVYHKMVADAQHQIAGLIKGGMPLKYYQAADPKPLYAHVSPTPINLVSGGAAWADHIAVSLYLMDHSDAPIKIHKPIGKL